jgi:hypothetical protein
MKKLATLIGTLALASTLAVTGCKKKEEGATAPATTEAPKAADPAAAPTPADPAAAPAADPAAAAPAADPAAAPAADPAAAAPAGDIPAECNDYKAALEKVAACDKLPAPAKDAYKNAWTGVETSLKAATTPETKAAVASACKSGAEGLKTAAAGCL